MIGILAIDCGKPGPSAGSQQALERKGTGGMDIKRGIIAVLGGGGNILGTGFLASQDLAITCAHVIELSGVEPGQRVTVRFEADGTEQSALVLPDRWSGVDEGDTAILRVDSIPRMAQPLRIASADGSARHDFYAYGYAIVTGVQGIGARGKIVDIVDEGRLVQLTSQEPDHGMSGGPVLDESRQVVVGMISKGKTSRQPERNIWTTFAISTDAIRQVCPELRFSEDCPYRELKAFTRSDRRFFFGRQLVIDRMTDILRSGSRFLAVLGPSGSGKSSVVQAGLLSALEQGRVPSIKDWRFIVARPASQPFEQLAAQGLVDPEKGLVESVRQWLDSQPGRPRLLLVIDQFEEALFSTPEVVRQLFIASLARLLDSGLDASLVLILRDDFYSRFQQLAQPLVPWLERGLVNIPPVLSKDDLAEIILKPAREVGLEFEAGLVETIIEDAIKADPAPVELGGGAASTVLPLLEFTLFRLWEERHSGLMTHDAFYNLGGVSGGLVGWAEEAIVNLPSDEKPIARLVLESLVHAGDEKQGVPDSRQTIPVSEIVLRNRELILAVVDKLVDERLLVAGRDEKTGQDTIELIHDVLIMRWATLQSWLRDDRPSLRIHQHLDTAARDWQESNDRGFLYRGKSLRDVEEWVARRGGIEALPEPEKSFLEASRGENRRQAARSRLFWLMVALIGAALIILGAGLPAYRAWLRVEALRSSLLVKLEGGKMLFGTDSPDRQSGDGEPGLQYVQMPDIWIEATEVTNSQYAKCVSARRCSKPLVSVDVDLREYGNRPVVNVTAFQAASYCAWVGRRLPTTFEWELAARGQDGRPWPWYDINLPRDDPRNLPTRDKGNFISSLDDFFPSESQPVGSFPNGATPEGVQDLYGNAWEWTNTTVDLDTGALEPWDLSKDVYLVQRGASWDSALDRITQIRAAAPDGLPDLVTGFRCIQISSP